MPKIGANTDRTFLIDDLPKQKGFYEILTSGDATDPFVKLIFANSRGKSEVLVGDLLSNWTKQEGTGFNNLTDFYNYIEPFFFRNAVGGGVSQDSLQLKGNWDADTNTPELLDSNGTPGDMYIVAVAGNTPLTGPGGVIYDDHLVGQEIYKTSDGFWEKIPHQINVYDSGTDAVTRADLRVSGDGYFSGEVFTQQGSISVGNVTHKSSNDRDFLFTDGSVYLKPRTKLSGVAQISSGSKEVVTLNPFLKTDPQGQLQPVIDRTITSTAAGSTGYYTHGTLATGIGNVWVENWYLRSSTGFTNYIVQGYKGHLDLGTITYELDVDGFPKVVGQEPFFLSSLRSDFLNGTAFTHGADVVNDIQVPLNTSTGYWQNDTEEMTFIAFASNQFSYEAGSIDFGFGPIDYPYILADGCNWDEINTSSKVVINGNLSLNEFNNVLQLNSNATEYYGCDILLEAGVYDRFEIPYKNANVTSGNVNLYVIILDQSDNTIAYKRELINTTITGSITGSGTFTINFDSDVLIKEGGIYQIVIGRRNWNSSNKRVELFHKDVNSSDGSVWVAYTGNNNSLDAGDTSGVDWSTINKQNFNRIPKALIYKY